MKKESNTLAEMYQTEATLRHSLASKVIRVESDLASLKAHGLISDYVYTIISKAIS